MTVGLTLLRNAFYTGSTPVLPGDVVRTSTSITNFNGNAITNVVMDGGLMNNMKVPVVDFSAATFTVAENQSGCVYTSSLNGDVDFQIPLGLSRGWNCVIVQLGTNDLNFVALAGVTILHRNDHGRLAGQYAAATLIVLDNAGTIVSLAGDTKS